MQWLLLLVLMDANCRAYQRKQFCKLPSAGNKETTELYRIKQHEECWRLIPIAKLPEAFLS